LMAYAIIDPAKNRAIITWGALVLLLRAMQRLLLSRILHDLFDIPIERNLVHVGYLALMAFILLALRPKKTDQQTTDRGLFPNFSIRSVTNKLRIKGFASREDA
jgi:hypothetical protein